MTKTVNAAGVDKIKRNIFAVQQSLTGIDGGDEILARSMTYWDLWARGPKVSRYENVADLSICLKRSRKERRCSPLMTTRQCSNYSALRMIPAPSSTLISSTCTPYLCLSRAGRSEQSKCIVIRSTRNVTPRYGMIRPAVYN